MPMLAEPRRKSKWTLNSGRRALWDNAESNGIKFGQGLMEKMGWRVGQGLGVNEQGMTEPLRISMKTDSKGIGFKNTDSIEWVQQQNDFNDLLEKLSFSNGIFENSACNDAEATKNKTRTSLEEKSKLSKTRVHYHKFTRGKDTTKYSDKDLECIVGSKKELFSDSKDDKDKTDSCSKLESDQSIIYAGSMVDYFSKKLQKKHSAGSNKTLHYTNRCQEFEDLQGNDSEEPENEICTMKKNKKESEKEIKSRYKMTDVRINDKDRDDKMINHYSLEIADILSRTVNKVRNPRNKYLNAVSIEDCMQDVNNERNGEKSYVRDENNCAQNYSGDNSDCRHFKKLKKKRRKEEREIEETHLGGVDHSEKEVNERLKERKFDNERDEHSEYTSTPWKRKRKKEKVKENNFDCYDSEENEKFNRGKRKKMDDKNEVLGESRKKKRKEKTNKAKNNVVYGESITNEEVEDCKISKSRKKKRREKAMTVSRNVDDDGHAECEQAADYRKDEDDFRNDEVQTEGESKFHRSKKRREKATEIREIIEDVDRRKCEVTDYKKDTDEFTCDDVHTEKLSKHSEKEKREEISSNFDGDGRVENEKVTRDKTDKIYSRTGQVHSEEVTKSTKQKGKKESKKISFTNLIGPIFPGSNLKELKGYGRGMLPTDGIKTKAALIQLRPPGSYPYRNAP